MKLFIFCLTLLLPLTAHAYIGPGLGVALAWTLLGPIAAFITAIALIAYFPMRYYYKKWKAKKNKSPLL